MTKQAITSTTAKNPEPTDDNANANDTNAGANANDTAPHKIKSQRASPNPTRDAAKGTLYSILLRIFSFLLTQLTLRLVDPTVLGRASIQLDLLLSSALFLGREGFRLALTRDARDDAKNQAKKCNEDDDEEEMVRRTRNVAWLSLPMGLFVSFLALCFHLSSSSSSSHPNDPLAIQQRDNLDYQYAGCLYTLAAAIETLAEPLFILHALRDMDVETRAAAEGAAALTKSMASILLLGFTQIGKNYPVSAFGWGQVGYALVFTTMFYLRRTHKQGGIAWPTFQTTNINTNTNTNTNTYLTTNFNQATLRLTLLFTLQGLFKHALTEGDRILLTMLASSYHQGTYAMASSYGSMASRLVFFPIEENARLLFARQHRGVMAAVQAKEGRRQQALQLQQTYYTLLKLLCYLGLLFATVAVHYTAVLLRLLAGSRWSTPSTTTTTNSAEQVLSAYCMYTAFLALNGTTEAFVYGVATTSSDISRLSLVHGLVGVLFFVWAPVAVGRWDTVGLVVVNMVGMGVRCGFSLGFAVRYFDGVLRREDGVNHSTLEEKKEEEEEEGVVYKVWRRTKGIGRILTHISPHPWVLVCFCASFVVTGVSQRYILQAEGNMSSRWWWQAGKHVLVGVGCVSVTLGVAFVVERRSFGKSLRDLVREKRD